MSKELDEALKNIKIRCHPKVVWDDPIDFDLEIVDQALLKAQTNEEILQKYYQEGITLDSVRALKQERDNYKKVLDIIKETKNIKVSFYENGSGKHYKLEFDRTKNQTITKEKFDLLKEFF